LDNGYQNTKVLSPENISPHACCLSTVEASEEQDDVNAVGELINTLDIASFTKILNRLYFIQFSNVLLTRIWDIIGISFT